MMAFYNTAWPKTWYNGYVVLETLLWFRALIPSESMFRSRARLAASEDSHAVLDFPIRTCVLFDCHVHSFIANGDLGKIRLFEKNTTFISTHQRRTPWYHANKNADPLQHIHTTFSALDSSQHPASTNTTTHCLDNVS